MHRTEKLTPKQEKVARIIADIFEMSGMSTAEAGHILECLIEVTNRSQLKKGVGPRLGLSMRS
jgi:hypothetical protein